MLALVLMAHLMSSAFANTTDSHSVVIENNEKTDSFTLSAIASRTEYRSEVIDDTCYRDELVNYRRVCNELIAVESKSGTRRAPEPPTCHDEPVYRQVAYSCRRTISVPYEVDDHQSTANVNVKISSPPKDILQSRNCGIDFSLTGDSFLSTNSCNQYLAMAQINHQDEGNVKNLSYKIDLYDTQKVFAPLAGGLNDLHVDGDVLLVKTGDLKTHSNFTLNLYVQRRRLFSSDVVLIDRTLSNSEFTYQPIDAHTGYVRIDLSKLAAGFIRGKKHVIRVNLNVILPAGSVIVGAGIPNLNQEASIKIR